VDSFRQVTHQGWFGRIGGAIKGMFFGLVLVVLALVMQFWNEGRTVKRDAALNEGRAQVATLTGSTPAAEHEGRLVHVSGAARASAPVQDAEFGVSLDALALRRRVEMYQWREKRDSREEKQVGGGTRTVTEYRYETVWDDDEIDSSRFEKRAGHENPGALPYQDQTWVAPDVRIGGFVLGGEVVREIGGWSEVKSSEVQLPPNLAASFRPSGDWFTTGAEPERPRVGDLRVRFEMVPDGDVSVVARQQGDALGAHTTSEGEELLLVERGQVTAGTMFDTAASNNSRTGWLLRAIGFAGAWLGFALLLKPIAVFADVVPLFGRIAGIGTGIAAGVLAALVSVLAIGSGWLFHRPWALVLLFIVVVGMIVWLMRGRGPVAASSAGAAPPPPPASPPPPPSA
jgi:hypothetical protein